MNNKVGPQEVEKRYTTRVKLQRFLKEKFPEQEDFDIQVRAS